MKRTILRVAATGLLFASACVVKSDLKRETYRIKVDLALEDGSPLPTEAGALCLDLRGDNPKCPKGQTFRLDLTAVDSFGQVDTGFNGYIRITTRPGSVQSVAGDAANGRNVLLKNGVASGQAVHLLGAFGPTRVQAEDQGYDPVDVSSGKVPQCADGIDNNGNGLIDFPADPGCAAPNDDSEDGGTAAAGVSPVIYYQYPDIPQVRGLGPATPFQEEQVVVETRAEFGANLIVTRVSSSGMFVTDLTPDPMNPGKMIPKDWGGLYIYNFQVPPGVRVCDRISYLSGTMSEFHGWAEMGFPSYGVSRWYPEGQPLSPGPCLVPDPIELTAGPPWPVQSKNNTAIQKVESGLVRVKGSRVGQHFGPIFGMEKPFLPTDLEFNPANNPCALTAGTQIEPNMSKYVFADDASACDFNHSGNTDFNVDIEETNCICWCIRDQQCSLFDEFEQRGSFRVIVDPSGSGAPENTILINTGTVAAFDPRAHRGQTIPSFTGTLAHFSGGDLNWTIETRCADDIIDCPAGDDACLANPPPSKPPGEACVKPRIASDNEANTN